MAAERFLVMGSNSFSGATFVAHLLDEDADIVGVSRAAEPADVFLPYTWRAHDRFDFRQLDLNQDADRLAVLLEEFQPEYIVNFAAQGMVAQSWDAPVDWFMTNTVAMARLHDLLKESAYLKKYVQVSTPEVYGSTAGVIRESTDYHPSTPYAVSKAACDMNLMAYHQAYDFPVVFTRAANVCGPGQQLYRIIPRTIFCILSGEKLHLQGGGTSVRSFIHMTDVAEATLRAARSGESGHIFHLSTDETVSIRELVQAICDEMGVAFDDHVEVVEGRRGQDAAYLLDWTTARKELGWSPERSLYDIVKETVAWMRERWDAIQEQPRQYIHRP